MKDNAQPFNFVDPIKLYFRNPIVSLPLIVLLIISLLAPIGTSSIQPLLVKYLTNSASLLVWLGLSFLVYLVVVSFFMGGAIFMSGSIIKREKITFFRPASKNLINVSLAILLTFMVFWLSFGITNLVLYLLSNSFSLTENAVKLISFFIMGASILGFGIFFTLLPFIVVLENNTFFSSVKRSFSLVKENYLIILSVGVIYFLISRAIEITLSNMSVIAAFIDYALLIPLLIFFLSSLVLKNRARFKKRD